MPGTETSGDCQYSLLKTIKQDVSGIETSKYATDKVPQMSFADVQNLYKQDQMSANLQDANHHLQPKHDTGLGECSQQIEIEKSMLPQMNMVRFIINLGIMKEQCTQAYRIADIIVHIFCCSSVFIAIILFVK